MRLTMFMVAIAALMSTLSTAQADTSPWIKGNQLRAYEQTIRKAGQKATALDCKSGPGFGANTGAVLFRFSSTANPSNARWSWNWGETGAYKKSSARMTKQGFKRVSTSSFVRKGSGLNITCSIWHHPG